MFAHTKRVSEAGEGNSARQTNEREFQLKSLQHVQKRAMDVRGANRCVVYALGWAMLSCSAICGATHRQRGETEKNAGGEQHLEGGAEVGRKTPRGLSTTHWGIEGKQIHVSQFKHSQTQHRWS